MPSLLDNQKGFISTALVVILLIAGIFGGVYLATHQTILQPKAASTAETSVNLSTTASNLKAGDEFPVNVTVRSDQVAAKRVVANLSFPKDLLEVKNIGIGNTNPPSQTPYPASGLVSYWKMDDCQETRINDSVGGNTGTLTVGGSGTQNAPGTCTGVSSTQAWSNGRVGKINASLKFDGTDDYVSMGHPQALSLKSGFTVSAWFKYVRPKLNYNGTYQGIITKGGVFAPNSNYAIGLRDSAILSTRRVYFYVINNGHSDGREVNNNSAFDGNWHLLTATFDGGKYVLYLDGSVLFTKTKAYDPILSNTNFEIGRDYFDERRANYYFSGQIDEVGVWNRGLNSSEITSLYNNGQGLAYQVPVATLNTDYFITNWQTKSFDNNTGTITLDGSVSDPGYQTSTDHPNTIMATITFRVKSTSTPTATISFDNSSGIYGLTNNLLATIKRNLNVNLVTPTPAPTIVTVSPTKVSSTQSVNVTWSGIITPHANDYMNLRVANDTNGTPHTYWINNNCTWFNNGTTGSKSGSCTINLQPESFPVFGDYFFDLRDGSTNARIAKSNLFTVTTPTTSPSPSSSSKRVFVTSTRYNGNLGGLSGADAKCQDRANAANLGGTWKAWLSDSTTSASSRLSHSNGPYLRLDGLVVANNWTGLTSGTLQNPLRVNENGGDQYIVTNAAWTSTQTDGSLLTPNCSNWTNGTYGVQGILGAISSTTSYWTVGANSTSICSNTISLYCFEQ